MRKPFRKSAAGTLSTVVSLAAIFLLGLGSFAKAQTIQPPYDSAYTLTNLGSVTGLPTNYGGLTFLDGDPNTIVIGGAANTSSGALYTIGVTRDAQNHITGFTGTATLYSDAQFNDGGVVFGPGGVLFYTRFPNNEVGEIKAGSSTTNKVVALTPLGVGSSVGALNFVPAGVPGAGQLKIVSYDTDEWYTGAFSADGSGTYDINSATLDTTIEGGPEGFIYVPTGSPIFPSQSMLVSEYQSGAVTTYLYDSSGNPNPASRAVFVSGLTGAEGATIDPVSGDFLFSTFGGENQVIAIRGFAPPQGPAVVPTLSFPILLLFALLLASVALLVMRRG